VAVVAVVAALVAAALVAAALAAAALVVDSATTAPAAVDPHGEGCRDSFDVDEELERLEQEESGVAPTPRSRGEPEPPAALLRQVQQASVDVEQLLTDSIDEVGVQSKWAELGEGGAFAGCAHSDCALVWWVDGWVQVVVVSVVLCGCRIAPEAP
jgi:hypothetical protein